MTGPSMTGMRLGESLECASAEPPPAGGAASRANEREEESVQDHWKMHVGRLLADVSQTPFLDYIPSRSCPSSNSASPQMSLLSRSTFVKHSHKFPLHSLSLSLSLNLSTQSHILGIEGESVNKRMSERDMF